MSHPEGEPVGRIPEEALIDPEAFIKRKLEEFNASLPNYPTTDEEWERRYQLLRQDPLSVKLRQQYEQATDAEKIELAWQQSERRRAIYTDPNPEGLINRAQEN